MLIQASRSWASRHTLTLFLDPVESSHGRHFELDLTPPLGLKTVEDEWSIERPAEAASLIDHLIGQGVAQATADPSGEVLVETNHGTRLTSIRWHLAGTDGEAWTPQVGGGIAHWVETSTLRRIRDEDELGAVALESLRRRKQSIDSSPARTTSTDVPTAEAEGMRVRAIDIDEETGVHLTLVEPESARTSDTNSQPSFFDAARFFATLRADDYAIPPDPEVLEAMSSFASSRLPMTLYVTFGTPSDPAGTLLSPAEVAGFLGSDVVSASIGHDGRLAVRTTVGAIASNHWGWSSFEPRRRWSGEGGAIERFGADDAVVLRQGEAVPLALAWLEHDLTGRDDRFWAWQRVNDLVQHDGAAGWAIVRLLIAGASSERQLFAIGAGPFEDLLGSHGEELIDHIEEAASAYPRVRQTLAGVWKSSIDDDVWRRVQSVIRRV